MSSIKLIKPWTTARPTLGPCLRPSAPVLHTLGRRELLQWVVALPFLLSKPAVAEGVDVETPATDSLVAPTAPVTAAPKEAQLFLDVEFQLIPPALFKFVDTQPVYDPTSRGPAPEPSPVRARFDSVDGSTVLSVVVRSAQSLRPSLLQVTDVSVFGGLEEAAKLLLPRGSRVLSASQLQVNLPAKQTALGPVDVPPKSYYRYEFTTTNGLHVVMSAAAMKGKVFVCGGSTGAGAGWEQYGSALRTATESFRLRSDNKML